MATVTTQVGSVLPDSTFYNVDVDAVTTATAAVYAWDTWTTSSSGTVEHSVEILGSFTYDAMGTPSGSVAQIRLDADADGIFDMTIAFPAFVAGLMPFLISGSEQAFFGAAFFQNDTITVSGLPDGLSSRLLAFGGNAVESNDIITITSYGRYSGDARSATGMKAGGNDVFTIDSVNSLNPTTIYGDFESGQGMGGNDSIVDVTSGGSLSAIRFIGIGDQDSALTGTVGGDDTIQGMDRAMVGVGDFTTISSNATVTGGDDTLIGGIGDDSLVGDIRIFNGSNSTVNGGDDSITGGAGDDTIYGEGVASGGITFSGGNDTLRGGDDNDQIFGGSGNDLLFGDDGDDLLVGGSGQDVFRGGDGSDTADLSDQLFALTATLADGSASGTAVSGGVTETLIEIENVIGTNVNDTFTGNSDSNTFEGGEGNDTMDGGLGTDIASYANALAAVTVDLAIQGTAQAVGGGQGSDQLTSIEGAIGSDFNDTIFGSTSNDSIQGGAGDDVLLTSSATSGFPFPGTDTIEGGAGNDTIGFALSGVGQSNLGSGHIFDGGFTSSNAVGDTFVFETFGSNYEVVVTGTDSALGSFTQLSTGNQIATLINMDNVIAGQGNDVIQGNGFRGGFIQANGGNDSVTVTRDYEVFGGSGDDTITGTSTNRNYTLHGGADNDVIRGNNDTDTLNGDGGNDRITFVTNQSASDTADGGTGTDTAVFGFLNAGFSITSAGGVVSVQGSSGTSQATLTDFEFFEVAGITFTEVELLATNFVFSSGGDDTVQGSLGGDVMFSDNEYIDNSLGGFGDVLLQGLSGNDALIGFRGRDTLEGGAGNDTLDGGERDDVLEGGADADVLRGGDDTDTASYATSDARVQVSLLSGVGIGGHATGDTFDSIEGLIGSAFNDSLSGDNGNNTVSGGADNDNINGRAGNDMLSGDDGDDSIAGGNDNDTLEGGDGADRLLGNGGTDFIVGDEFPGAGFNDTIFAGAGDDFAYGIGGDDSILGQGGNDELAGFEGNDTLLGGSGNDSLFGEDGDDRLFGNGNNDFLNGGADNDNMQGAAGFDTLIGGSGNDTMTGGAGADSLDGGTGDDVMNGGTSADRFVFMVGYENDRINTFEQVGADKLELDQNLWIGTDPTLTEQEVIDDFGMLNGTGTILTLNFGNGDVLEIQNALGIDQSTLGTDVIFI